MAEQFALLLIKKVLCSDLSLEIGYPDKFFDVYCVNKVSDTVLIKTVKVVGTLSLNNIRMAVVIDQPVLQCLRLLFSIFSSCVLV